MARHHLLCVAALLATAGFLTARASRPPNVVIFLADDVGYGDIGAYGAPVVQTPNLDAMADEGMRLTQWYSAAPLCTPSRGAMLTGRLPIRIGLFTKYPYPVDLIYRVFFPSSVGSLPKSEKTLADLLKPAGYYSALIGKWHLGHVEALPTQRGFDYFYGIPYAHDEGYPGSSPFDTVFPPVPVYENETLVEQPVDLNTITARLIAHALAIIDKATENDQPFFVVVSFPQAHIPSFASNAWHGMSRGGPYGDMVEEMDAAIGTILQGIQQRGLDEQTLSIFTSDNGAWPFAVEPRVEMSSHQPDGGSNGPFREGKGSTWEGGVREPTIIRWPGHIEPRRVSIALATHMDIVPTVLELAGLSSDPDRPLDGRSLVPLLLGHNETGPHEFIYLWRERTLMAIRYGPWKAHFVTRSGFGNEQPRHHNPPLFFNVERDPGERFSLAPEDLPEGVFETMLEEAERHRASIEEVPSQYDEGGSTLPGNDFTVVPCCRPFASSHMDVRKLMQSRWSVCFCDDTVPPTVEPSDLLDDELTHPKLGALIMHAMRLADAY